MNSPGRFICRLVECRQPSVGFRLLHTHTGSSPSFSCLLGHSTWHPFYFPEHPKTLENSRRLVSSTLSLACFTQTWQRMKARLSGGCWTGLYRFDWLRIVGLGSARPGCLWGRRGWLNNFLSDFIAVNGMKWFSHFSLCLVYADFISSRLSGKVNLSMFGY